MEDIEPTEAVRMYLADKQPELAQSTIYSHRSRLSHFTEWCAGEGDIKLLSELDPIDCHRYKQWRRDEHDINNVTLKTQLDTLRVFLRWADETIDAAKNDISEAVLSPALSDGDNERDVMLDPEAAQAILDYLEKYGYASNDHVTMLLLWRCILRRGSLRALDLRDCELDTDNPVLDVQHRPASGTPLKNQGEGERVIALAPGVRETVNDFIDTNRDDVTDDGRKPLITTVHGRPHVQTIQATAYACTRPCAVGNEWPHDRDPEACDAAKDRQLAYECPSSVSPHAIRRGAITHWLQNDVPQPAVSSRADVQSDTLDKHYDQRTERQKAEQRRKYLDQV
ncbi:tyrosine-type recombinase/integrase [Halorubrum sp. AD140]|uniref:tyrosine-type recombinase/integrase n=1 Tax=Halorubrum sp. AD140 TaxID=3050073 RepID=UPI002ACCCC87|nr:phage integrase SAM-like domain-containing protein [Halorubrum sp. AD140]MDZ5810569.1 tyrosine-type recombinase/integrase [Halorubrum sp. AD140]